MKAVASIVALIAITAGPAVAQQYWYFPDSSVGIGQGSNSWPFNFDSSTGRFQQALNPENSTGRPAGPVKIVEVAFVPSPLQFVCSRDFQLRLGAARVSRLPSLSARYSDNCPCPTNLVDSRSGFSYNPTRLRDTWVDIGTDRDGAWDGTSALCIEVRFRGNDTNRGVSCSAAPIPRAWSNVTTTDNYDSAVAAFTAPTNGLRTRLRYVTDHVCIVPPTTRVGRASTVALYGFNPGDSYYIAASLGQSGRVSLGNHRVFLDQDALFLASLNFGGSVFGNYAGIVNANGQDSALFSPPGIAALVGTCVYHAAIALDQSAAVTGSTNTAGTLLVP